MKSRSMKGAAAGVALVTVAAMSATAMPQIFSESDSFFAGSNDQGNGSLTEVPDLPDDATVAAAKDDPDAQAKLREDLKEILKKSNQRLAEVEGQTLSANEKALELSEAAAEARRDAETASQQAELAADDNEEAQENAGEAAADMYRNGGLSTEEFMLGDEDALRTEQNSQQIAGGLTDQAASGEYNENAHNALNDNEGERADAEEESAQKAQDKADAVQQRLEEEEAQRLADQQEERAETHDDVDERLQAAGYPENEVDVVENELNEDQFEEVTGVTTASSQTSPTSTDAVDDAPVTPAESETEEEAEEAEPEVETEEDTEEAEPEVVTEEETEEAEPEAPAETEAPSPTQTATPTPTQTSTPSSTPTPTPTQTQTSTPTQTQTSTPTPTQTSTPTPTPTPTQTTPPPSSGGNMSAAVNWAVNKTNESGTSYVWGGNGPKGYDCSGFTVAAFAQSGKSLPRTSSAQYGAAKQYVSLDNIQQGDLVFWSNNGSGSGVYHVAIYIGNGQIAHARNPSTGITVTSLHYSPWGMMNVAGRY